MSGIGPNGGLGAGPTNNFGYPFGGVPPTGGGQSGGNFQGFNPSQNLPNNGGQGGAIPPANPPGSFLNPQPYHFTPGFNPMQAGPQAPQQGILGLLNPGFQGLPPPSSPIGPGINLGNPFSNMQSGGPAYGGSAGGMGMGSGYAPGMPPGGINMGSPGQGPSGPINSPNPNPLQALPNQMPQPMPTMLPQPGQGVLQPGMGGFGMGSQNQLALMQRNRQMMGGQ